MRTLFLSLGMVLSAGSALAQQGTTVQMQCHEPAATGNALAPDETLVNGMACKVVKPTAAPAPAVQEKPAPPPAKAETPAPASAPGDGRLRVFISDSKSWEMSGGFAVADGNGGGATKGGARPQTAEIIKTFGERCPTVTVTMKQDRADYVVLLDHEGGKGLALKDNKVAVFDKEGDSIFSHSTRSLGNAVKDGCDAILKDQAARRR